MLLHSAHVAALVVIVLLALGFLFFVVHTLRCYLNKPRADDEDEEFRVQYNEPAIQPNSTRPI